MISTINFTSLLDIFLTGVVIGGIVMTFVIWRIWLRKRS